MPGVECLPQLLPGYFALRHAAAGAHDPQSECRRLLRAKAADRFGLAGKADVGANRRLTRGAAAATDAFVGPSGAVRRTGLDRNILGYGFGRWALRNGEFGRGAGTAAGNDDRQRDSEPCNENVIWPHAVFLTPMNARHIRLAMPAEDLFLFDAFSIADKSTQSA